MQIEKIGDLEFQYDVKNKEKIDDTESVWVYDNVKILASDVYQVGKIFEQMSIGYKYNNTSTQITISFETFNGCSVNAK